MIEATLWSAAVPWIVDRCHVGDTPREVIRFFRRRIRRRAWSAMGRRERRELLRAILERHEENREVFRRYRF